MHDLAKQQRKQQAQQHLLEKLRMIRALHIAAYNAPHPVADTAPEFFYAIGDILEGQSAHTLRLKNIDTDEFLKELLNG